MNQRQNRLSFSLRDLIWFMLVTALAVGFVRERATVQVLKTANQRLESELKTSQTLASVLTDMYRVTNYEAGPSTANGRPLYLNKRLDSYDIMRLLLSKSNCVILGEIEEEPGIMMAHEAASHFSAQLKVRILDIAKGEGLPIGELICIHIDSVPDLFPKKGEKKVFLVGPANLKDLRTLATDDIRFCVEPASLFAEFKREADEMRRTPVYSP
jgi:hypothetical protein